MISWPENLNSFAERGSWSFKQKMETVRTDFDSGPSRVRRRFTVATSEATFTIMMNYTEVEYLKIFIDEKLSMGVKWFLMPVFVGGAYKSCVVRFKNSDSPIEIKDNGYNNVLVTLTLEIRDSGNVFDELSKYLLEQYGEAFTVHLCDVLQKIVNIDYPRISRGP